MVAVDRSPLHVVSDEETSKRRQILEGARKVFLDLGFDGASMGEIARAAGVSKGTLYVYFKDKEQLFEAIVMQECEAQAEGIFDLDPADHDVETVLTRLGFNINSLFNIDGVTAVHMAPLEKMGVQAASRRRAHDQRVG